MSINDQLTFASKSYSEDEAQRALMSNIPLIGSALDNIFTSKWSKYYQDRLELFQTFVIKEFEHIEEKNVKFEFLETPELFDLIITLIESSIKARHSGKVELFRKTPEFQADKTFTSQNEPDDYTYIVKELTPHEMLIIQAIEKLNKDFELEIENTENPRDVYDFISINKLESYAA